MGGCEERVREVGGQGGAEEDLKGCEWEGRKEGEGEGYEYCL